MSEEIEQLRSMNHINFMAAEGWKDRFSELQSENSALRSMLERMAGSLLDIKDNYDCECVEGTRTIGEHRCQSCTAFDALAEYRAWKESK